MPSNTDRSRREFLALTSVGIAALAGCTDRSSLSSTAPSTTPTTTADADGPVDAIERDAVPVALVPDSDRLDAVASRLATVSIVGIGETSHGVAEFKTVPRLLVRRLVTDHGYRLLAMEGTLGDFASVNAYVTGGDVDLDTALSSLDFYFWRTEGIGRLFAWLREFNRGRPESAQVTVHGYDAQFHDVNATAIRSYLRRVDPAYLDDVAADLDPLTHPLYEQSDPEYMTPSHVSLLDSLRDRLRTHREAYIDRSSTAEWRLARRHVWTTRRGLQFLDRLHAEAYTEGKRIRERAMAENVAWLRDWADADRAIVIGNANHTMRNDSAGEGGGDTPPRMGQHLTDELGSDYYSLGLTFGTGEFAAPTNHDRTAFTTYTLDGPVEGSLEATLAVVDDPPFFLDFDTARRHAAVERFLNETQSVQFSVPRAATRGAVALPASPDSVYDGVVFVRTVSPASFVAGG